VQIFDSGRSVPAPVTPYSSITSASHRSTCSQKCVAIRHSSAPLCIGMSSVIGSGLEGVGLTPTANPQSCRSFMQYASDARGVSCIVHCRLLALCKAARALRQTLESGKLPVSRSGCGLPALRCGNSPKGFTEIPQVISKWPRVNRSHRQFADSGSPRDGGVAWSFAAPRVKSCNMHYLFFADGLLVALSPDMPLGFDSYRLWHRDCYAKRDAG
jgi:hypothetical protein